MIVKFNKDFIIKEDLKKDQIVDNQDLNNHLPINLMQQVKILFHFKNKALDFLKS